MPVQQQQLPRCGWCQGDELYEQYHDEEWGVPVFRVSELFERLALESMQAGLAWITVLKKREHMRKRFHGFDPHKLALCDESDIADWLGDAGIIRHRGKLQALIQNARIVVEEADFAKLVWQFAPVTTPASRADHNSAAPSATVESQAMAKALKAKGLGFVGPTICYAFMQSVGMVNDHTEDCWRFSVCKDLQHNSKAG